MAEVTVTVPAEHVPAFREGILAEIASDITWAQQMHEETDDHLLGRLPGEGIKPMQLADLRNPIRALGEELALLEQVWTWEDDGPVEVTGSDHSLAHILGTTADRIIAPELRGEVNISPIDDAVAENVEALMDGLRWMVDTAADVNPERAMA
jgi:hypothetical protein